MTMPGSLASIDDGRPAGMSVRTWQMLKRFPKGSFARVKSVSVQFALREEVVQIFSVIEGVPMRFRVLLNPFNSGSSVLKEVDMRDLVRLDPLEVLAEASR